MIAAFFNGKAVKYYPNFRPLMICIVCNILIETRAETRSDASFVDFKQISGRGRSLFQQLNQNVPGFI
jgi:hypothetical protein